MNWYLAKIVYRITCGSGTHQPQFDEQLRLVQAGSAAEALGRATELGQRGEDHFPNRDAQLVTWTFVNVPELYPLQTQLDGAELYSQVREADDASAYINFVHYKAHCLRERAGLITNDTIAYLPL
ncbi:DUF4288 domain-containing protein [Flaviaesturariibacter aridisoli]|uniref:DUF4288 domain-containing protein n=1 Tax=Flaviaesturariibacter aridisoli TaxID=2545761 RepID=A0A4R4DY96_9BACT|nr:DUF4288 domain-containing protein [Flaviaesturariibacter aridisoli]TCZ68578.1 DUF4288 domain-containing protein [Flaviaesturariibacter aridisoli]